jgi:uncharacterized protein YdeI (YjbR/CyaY-like superfamily)
MKPEIMEFTGKIQFRRWLKNNHKTHVGIDIYLYKKGYEELGLTYDDAVRIALCYGWIDAVTHSHDEKKFRQYFAPRKKRSHWSLSNIIRMEELIESKEMTAFGLKYFDLSLLDQLKEMIAEDQRTKKIPIEIPGFFKIILAKEKAESLFRSETPSAQRRYVLYILDAQKEETRIRRCRKVIGILREDKNNR